MTAASERLLFKRAVYFSLGAHFFFVLFILVSPHFPRPSRKGLIHYIPLNMVVAGGGGGGGRGGGGGGSGSPAAGKPAPPAKKETLRDLTIPQKVQPEAKPTMRYPVEKPAREPKAKVEKKAAISKPEASPQGKTAQNGVPGGVEGGTGMGTGLRIGGGEGPGGPGYGSGGLANFPYTYYLNIITDRVSSNWFSSLVDPGISGSFQTIIYFRIEKSGQVSDIKIEQSSGVTPLDLSAVRAVKASAPFPPLPREYEDAYLGIHLIFEHSK
jgi:TonB family protein